MATFTFLISSAAVWRAPWTANVVRSSGPLRRLALRLVHNRCEDCGEGRLHWDRRQSYLLPDRASRILGAFVADCYLGRYRTIVVVSLLYILSGSGYWLVREPLHFFVSKKNRGVTILDLNWNKDLACLLSRPFFLLLVLLTEKTTQSTPCSSRLQELLFFYLVALRKGGHKPCIQAFGAYQFSGQDAEECRTKSSFFNWWNFGLCAELSGIASPGMRKPVCENW
ncbi:hypothetical protein ACLB2K_041805 [Fragaria x ananassa]